MEWVALLHLMVVIIPCSIFFPLAGKTLYLFTKPELFFESHSIDKNLEELGGIFTH